MLLIVCRLIVFIAGIVSAMKTTKLAQSFGRVIRQRRLSLGLSQEVLAHECALHRTYMGSVERGERNVSLENIVKIARALGVKASKLLDEAGI